MAEKLFKEYIRPSRYTLEFSTANQRQVYTNDGMRMQVAHTDVPFDTVLMEDAPYLLSVGGRCMNTGYSFLWVNQRLPCMFPPGIEYVVIFDLDGVVPIYCPSLEQPGGRMGTFDLALNAFRERCGFIINGDAYIQLITQQVKGWKKGVLHRQPKCCKTHGRRIKQYPVLT